MKARERATLDDRGGRFAPIVECLREMEAAGVPCMTCRQRRATVLKPGIGAMLCRGCADTWATLSPIERRAQQLEWARR